ARRQGKSHINLLHDGLRFFLIIFKVGTLYSPLKIFMPISVFFFLMSVGYYSYTYFTTARFTNMGLLLFVTSVLVFLIGLVSEQITTLMYQNQHVDNES
ncbi:Glycosyltransferase involved in cell wall biogenesis, partial [hydrothermal vent metagenome]